MANFCGKCGSGLDAATGLCPNCDSEQLNAMRIEKEKQTTNTSKFCSYCGDTVNSVTGLCTNPNCVTNVRRQTKPVVESKNTKSKTTTTLISVLLAICLFITSALSVVIVDVRNTLKKDNIGKIIGNVQVTEFVDQESIDDFSNKMNEKFGMEITAKKINKFFNRSTAKSFISKKAVKFSEKLFAFEDAELSVTKDEFMDFLYDNSDLIDWGDEYDYDYSYDDYDDYYNYYSYSNYYSDVYDTDYKIEYITDWIFDDDEMIIIDTAKLKSDYAVLYYLVTIGLSYFALAFFIILSAVIIFFMIKNKSLQAILGIGITFTVLGSITGIAAVLSGWITPVWEAICGNSPIGIVIGEVAFINAVLSLILFVLGIALIVFKNLALKHNKSNNFKN